MFLFDLELSGGTDGLVGAVGGAIRDVCRVLAVVCLAQRMVAGAAMVQRMVAGAAMVQRMVAGATMGCRFRSSLSISLCCDAWMFGLVNINTEVGSFWC